MAAVLIVTSGLYAVALAQSTPEFKLGFEALANQIPDVVGQPLENEHWGANGDSTQRTVAGLLVWRKLDNWTAFTNGHMTWISGPGGTVRSRLNTERFIWERDPPPRVGVQPAPLPPTVQAWSQVFADQKLRDALAYGYGYALDWRPIAEQVAAKAVPVQWGSVPNGANGVYRYDIWSYSSGRTEIRDAKIILSPSLRGESAQVIAAMLAHETVHAATIDGPMDSASCFDGETAAFTYEAYVWQQLPGRGSTTSNERALDYQVKQWLSGTLDRYVHASPLYLQQCSKVASR